MAIIAPRRGGSQRGQLTVNATLDQEEQEVEGDEPPVAPDQRRRAAS
jgi:hypothetical protein